MDYRHQIRWYCPQIERTFSFLQRGHSPNTSCMHLWRHTYGSLFGNYCPMFPWLVCCCCSLRVWWTLSDWRNLWLLVPRSLESGWAWGLASHLAPSTKGCGFPVGDHSAVSSRCAGKDQPGSHHSCGHCRDCHVLLAASCHCSADR